MTTIRLKLIKICCQNENWSALIDLNMLYNNLLNVLKRKQAHSLSRVSSVGNEGVDEELVSVSSCNVQWCISVFIFTVNLSTFR